MSRALLFILTVYGVEEVTDLRHRINRHDARQAMLFRQFMAGAEVLALDANGRFLISKRLLAAAQLESRVRFIGLDERIELWSAELMDVPSSDAELAQGMQNLFLMPPTMAFKLRRPLAACQFLRTTFPLSSIHSTSESHVSHTRITSRKRRRL